MDPVIQVIPTFGAYSGYNLSPEVSNRYIPKILMTWMMSMIHLSPVSPTVGPVGMAGR